MLVVAADGGGVGGEAARRLVVGVEVQLTAVHVLHALVRTRSVGRVRRGDLRGGNDKQRQIEHLT